MIWLYIYFPHHFLDIPFMKCWILREELTLLLILSLNLLYVNLLILNAPEMKSRSTSLYSGDVMI